MYTVPEFAFRVYKDLNPLFYAVSQRALAGILWIFWSVGIRYEVFQRAEDVVRECHGEPVLRQIFLDMEHHFPQLDGCVDDLVTAMHRVRMAERFIPIGWRCGSALHQLARRRMSSLRQLALWQVTATVGILPDSVRAIICDGVEDWTNVRFHWTDRKTAEVKTEMRRSLNFYRMMAKSKGDDLVHLIDCMTGRFCVIPALSCAVWEGATKSQIRQALRDLCRFRMWGVLERMDGYMLWLGFQIVKALAYELYVKEGMEKLEKARRRTGLFRDERMNTWAYLLPREREVSEIGLRPDLISKAGAADIAERYEDRLDWNDGDVELTVGINDDGLAWMNEGREIIDVIRPPGGPIYQFEFDESLFDYFLSSNMMPQRYPTWWDIHDLGLDGPDGEPVIPVEWHFADVRDEED